MQLIYVDDRVIGTLEAGVFTQTVTERHIYQRWNAKGMDLAVLRNLEGRARLWRLHFKKTGQVLSIPFSRIRTAGFVADAGGGKQMFVKLSEFTEEKPVSQLSLI